MKWTLNISLLAKDRCKEQQHVFLVVGFRSLLFYEAPFGHGNVLDFAVCQWTGWALSQGNISTTELYHFGNIGDSVQVLLVVGRLTCQEPKPNHVGNYSISKSKSLGKGPNHGEEDVYPIWRHYEVTRQRKGLKN